MKIFSGSAHKSLAQEIASKLSIDLGELKVTSFPDGEIGIQIMDCVVGEDLFVVQTLAKDPNHYAMELFIMVDALKQALCRSVTAVIPYFCYARQDRNYKGGEPVTARLLARFLHTCGVDRVIAMDLHTEQLEGFFDIPVMQLRAKELFIKEIKKLSLSNPIVVAPDVGSAKLASRFADDVQCGCAVIDKKRGSGQTIAMGTLMGDVKGKEVLIVDDICSTGQTLKQAASLCRKEGAKSVYGFVTHSLLSTWENETLDGLFVSDSIEQVDDQSIHLISTADLFSRAMKQSLQYNIT